MARTIATRTIVDVTQLVHWGGEITGIPRVMHEMAVRFRATDPNAIFVTWVKEIRELCEIDLDKTLAHRGHGIDYLFGSQTAAPAPAVASSNSAQSQSISATDFMKKVAKKGVGGIRRLSPRVATSLETRAKLAAMRRYKRVEFGEGDQLFIPWGEWWDANFIAKLEEIEGQGAKLVQVLHDMAPVVVPQLSNSGNATETFPIYCRRILPICSLVLSVSENSKRDALKWLKDNKLPIPKIEVFRLGDDIKIAKPAKPQDKGFDASGLKGHDYIMVVGTIELKKNHMLFYYVYKLAKARGIKLPKLVIAGRYGWMAEATVELMSKDPEVADQFVFMVNKSDQELSWLYDHCMFTVLPSLYEGWGIPIAESVARGVPCLCSDTSSMTEIAEDFVEHFNPNSTDECLAGIQRWLEPSKLKKLRQHTKTYKQFSWDESFAQVTTHMKEML